MKEKKQNRKRNCIESNRFEEKSTDKGGGWGKGGTEGASKACERERPARRAGRRRLPPRGCAPAKADSRSCRAPPARNAPAADGWRREGASERERKGTEGGGGVRTRGGGTCRVSSLIRSQGRPAAPLRRRACSSFFTVFSRFLTRNGRRLGKGGIRAGARCVGGGLGRHHVRPRAQAHRRTCCIATTYGFTAATSGGESNTCASGRMGAAGVRV